MLKSFIEPSKRLVRSILRMEPYLGQEEAAYRRLVAKGYAPRNLIDVGAYHGDWTRLAHRVFGSIPTLMVEAQPQRSSFLEQTCRDLQNVRYTSALLTDCAGQMVTFYEMETGSSVMAERSNAARKADSFVTNTLDNVAVDVGACTFLKIDVQGAELEVLAGGGKTLVKADVVQLEVGVNAYNEGAPTMMDVLSFMSDRGFVPYDISGMTRPTGNELAQIDVIFTRADSTLRPEIFRF